jgi:hypothetical protein
MAVVTNLVNNSSDEFGWEDSWEPSPMMKWMTTLAYGPIIIDLEAFGNERLEEMAIRLGRSRDREGNLTVKGDSRYGMVYFSNLKGHSAEQLERLSVVSREVFSTDVTYGSAD